MTTGRAKWLASSRRPRLEPMPVVCRVCGQENPDAARFCHACGAALSAEPPREERKVVTVLFADLVGFTARAEQLDPEDVARAAAPVPRARCAAELERFGGTVEKFIGDAVMALFGAPVAHEDDPERAVRAALAIRDWAREEDDARSCGSPSTPGEALVSLGARPGGGRGDGRRRRRQHRGAAAVRRAGERHPRRRDDVPRDERRDRLPRGRPGRGQGQGRAGAGVGGARRRARGSASTSTSARRRRSSAASASSSSSSDALDRARARARRRSSSRSSASRASASRRLVAELFARRRATSPSSSTWRQGRSLPYGEGVSFWALGEMVKAQAGILETDAPRGASEKLRARGRARRRRGGRARLGRGAPAAARRARRRRRAGGDARRDASRPGGASSRRSPSSGRSCSSSRTCTGPTTACSTSSTTSSTGRRGVPLLVLCTARPELLERRPGWGGGKLERARRRALAARRTTRRRSSSRACSSRRVLPAETQQRCSTRAGGNPLYAEQYARLLVERGSADGPAAPRDGPGHHRRAARRASAGRSACCRTPPWSARCSGPERCARRTAGAGERAPRARAQGASSRRERRSSVEGEPSTRSGTCSSATSPTGRSRAPRARDEARPRGGVDRGARPRRRPRGAARAPLRVGARARARRRP